MSRPAGITQSCYATMAERWLAGALSRAREVVAGLNHTVFLHTDGRAVVCVGAIVCVCVLCIVRSVRVALIVCACVLCIMCVARLVCVNWITRMHLVCAVCLYGAHLHIGRIARALHV